MIDRNSFYIRIAVGSVWKNSACNHTRLNRKNKKVLVNYGRNSMSDLASSNGVAINDVNGRIGNTKPG